MCSKKVVLYLICIAILLIEAKCDFELSIIHFNDFHARFDEQSSGSRPCNDPAKCHGGFSRLYHKINELRAKRPNSILLDAGDSFQGSLWYNIFKWNVTQYFMNMLPTAAYTLGNHEFDEGIAGLVPYLQAMKAPCVICNIDDSLEPDLQGLYNKSIILEVQGKRIGVIGVVTSLTSTYSSPGKVTFLDEIDSVNAEALKLKEQNVFTIIVLSHCGYDLDKVMAAKAVKGISLIVGGHSHSLLYTGNPPDGSKSQGPYPTIVQRKVDSKNVLITQASSNTRYLGDITINYDDNGEVMHWTGEPIYLSPKVPQDPAINDLLAPYKQIVYEAIQAGKIIIGETLVKLSPDTCWYEECLLGNLLTDAMLYAFEGKNASNCLSSPSVSFINHGAMRGSFEIGNITYNDLGTVQPFKNTFDSGVLQGKGLKAVLEQTAIPYSLNQKVARVNLLQISGLKVVYDLSQREGSRVIFVHVRNPCSRQYEALHLERNYSVAVVSFLGAGGDGFTTIPENIKNYKTGKLDIDVYVDYIKAKSPLSFRTEGKMVFEGPLGPNK